ncbi:MAG: uroporphyrinogen-III synthase [Bacteroidales bacterium]
MKIRRILVSQPEPSSEKSPYYDLAERIDVKIDFVPFIQVEGVSTKEFRQTRIQILEHQAVLFTSKTAIDHYFAMCRKLRIEVPDAMKYYCISETAANYMQKYVIYRKRKIFFSSTGNMDGLMTIIKKQQDKEKAKENILLPLSEIHKEDIPTMLTKNKVKFTKAILYRTVSSDLSSLKDIDYDIVAFFSPAGVKSFVSNFPNFDQKGISIAAFGNATAKAVKDAKLKLNINAPTKEAPSMTMALEQFIDKHNKKVTSKS